MALFPEPIYKCIKCGHEQTGYVRPLTHQCVCGGEMFEVRDYNNYKAYNNVRKGDSKC